MTETLEAVPEISGSENEAAEDDGSDCTTMYFWTLTNAVGGSFWRQRRMPKGRLFGMLFENILKQLTGICCIGAPIQQSKKLLASIRRSEEKFFEGLRQIFWVAASKS